MSDLSAENSARARRLTLIRRLDIAGLALSVLGLAVALAWAFPLYWSVMATIVLAPADASSGATAGSGYTGGSICCSTMPESARGTFRLRI